MLNIISRRFTTSPTFLKAAATAAGATLPKYWMLQYNYVPNVVEKRAPFRQQHLEFIKTFVDNGSVLLGGAFADPVDGAAIVFRNVSKDIVEGFAKNDPYVINGIVTKYIVREWTVVVSSLPN